MFSARIACRPDILEEVHYRLRVFPRKGAVLHPYRYLLLHLVELVCHIVVITGLVLEKAVLYVIYSRGETINDELEYSEAGYVQISFWFRCVSPQHVANRHIIPYR